MMKKVLISVALMSLLVFPLLAKGGSEEVSQNGPVTINHWYWVPNADIEKYTKMIDEFNSSHPEVKVVWENVPQKDVRTKFITAYQVGEGPDTFAMSQNWVPEFAAMNMLEPLDAYVDKWPGEKEIFGNLWESAEIGGKKYGMPWKLLVTYMY